MEVRMEYSAKMARLYSCTMAVDCAFSRGTIDESCAPFNAELAREASTRLARDVWPRERKRVSKHSE